MSKSSRRPTRHTSHTRHVPRIQPDAWADAQLGCDSLRLALLSPADQQLALAATPAASRLGLLLFLAEHHLVPLAQLRRLLATAWPGSRRPPGLDVAVIVDLFRSTGFVTDAWPGEPPTGPLTLYRGVTVPGLGVRGLSWTPDVTAAAWFAQSRPPMPLVRYGALIVPRADVRDLPSGPPATPGAIYTATIEPQHVLARFRSAGFPEIVVDPRGLRQVRRLAELPERADGTDLGGGRGGAMPDGGDLAYFEFCEDAYDRFIALAAHSNAAALVARITAGYLARTPTGSHVVVRCRPPGPSYYLAARLTGARERERNPASVRLLLAYRGEDSAVPVAPSPGTDLVRGGLATTAEITPAERDLLLTLGRQLDRIRPPRPAGRSVLQETLARATASARVERRTTLAPKP